MIQVSPQVACLDKLLASEDKNLFSGDRNTGAKTHTEGGTIF